MEDYVKDFKDTEPRFARIKVWPAVLPCNYRYTCLCGYEMPCLGSKIIFSTEELGSMELIINV
jgi:hypothetical protein